MKFDAAEMGNRIYAARISKNLTQIGVSTYIGISQSTYSKLEYGKFDPPASVLAKLSEVLEVSVSWILGTESNRFTRPELIEIEKFKKYIISNRKK